jgi:hypothetical protein
MLFIAKALLVLARDREIWREQSSVDAALQIPHESLEFTFDHLLLTCDNCEIGHVKEQAMFHYSDYGIDLGGNCVRAFEQKTGAVENKIPFIGDVASTVVIRSKRWRKAELTKCVAHQWNGHRNYFNR